MLRQRIGAVRFALDFVMACGLQGQKFCPQRVRKRDVNAGDGAYLVTIAVLANGEHAVHAIQAGAGHEANGEIVGAGCRHKGRVHFELISIYMIK